MVGCWRLILGSWRLGWVSAKPIYRGGTRCVRIETNGQVPLLFLLEKNNLAGFRNSVKLFAARYM